MVSDNMMVRRLLSVLNWDPSERKCTKGGRLLILRGVHFGPKLFPEIVIPCNHAGPLVDSAMGHDAPFQTLGPSEPWILSSPVSQEIWHCSLPRKQPS